mmetsp:Transcript_14421/g.27018  ORF Transcript_14421/g.27018 Transcript_14421/m.27018 type:complete len:438 (+) Transcript_14421:68-1381(+)
MRPLACWWLLVSLLAGGQALADADSQQSCREQATCRRPTPQRALTSGPLMIQMSKVSVGKARVNAAEPSHLEDALQLLKLVNDYRTGKGLAAVEVSPALMAVAFAHIRDLLEFRREAGCNMHSWSESHPDWWSGCCYTPDHSEADCMWRKGKEVTWCWETPYSGSIYENAYSGPSDPNSAMNAWKGSSAHNAVILNEGIWSRLNPWPAVGAAIWGGYAVLIFGDRKDGTGPLSSTTVYPHCGPDEYRPAFSLPATTPAPQTTTTVAPSTTSPPTPDFSAVDGGEDRACRDYRGKNSPDFYSVVRAASLKDCQALCATSQVCSGVEYSSGRCEIWTAAIGASKALSGFSCWRYKLPVLQPVDGGSGRACRGASEADNSASYYRVFRWPADIDACRALCGVEEQCKGIEYSSGRCEVWIREGGIQASKSLPGFTCLKVI